MGMNCFHNILACEILGNKILEIVVPPTPPICQSLLVENADSQEARPRREINLQSISILFVHYW